MANFNVVMLLFLLIQASFIHLGRSELAIGVCYGLKGDNLPAPTEVVNLYKKLGIKKMRIFEPYPKVLEALKGSNITLTLGVLNQDIPVLASSVDAANTWFVSHVQPYVNDVNIDYIGVGNEVVPGEFSESILPAMQNLQSVLDKNNLGTKTTTVVADLVLGTSYPPSAGQFSDKSRPFMTDIIKFLSSQKTPLLVNLYPYLPCASDPANINLDYALLGSEDPFVTDGSLTYSKLIDAMLDSFYSAMEKEGVDDVNIIVSESGWPHEGDGDVTTPEHASTYNKNFVNRVESDFGTPKKPNVPIQGFIFAIMDEDSKEARVEQHWGIFNHNLEPNYELF